MLEFQQYKQGKVKQHLGNLQEITEALEMTTLAGANSVLVFCLQE